MKDVASRRRAPWPRLIVSALLAGTTATFVFMWAEVQGRPAPPQEIPRVWDDAALKEFELPLPDRSISIEHITSDYYYAIPERVTYKTYPMYHPKFEPPGYLDSLRTLEPEVTLDTDTLDTPAEWIRAGEIVFDAPQGYIGVEGPFSALALARAGVPVAADGTFPHQSYVVVAKGDVRVGVGACNNCHLRVMPDGSVLKGVQGNFPFDRLIAQLVGIIRERGSFQPEGAPRPITVTEFLSGRAREQFGAPWIDHLSQTMLDTVSVDRSIALFSAVPPGSLRRQGTNFFYPTKVPDLRGVRHKRFLDATGLIQQRSMVDLMRYASFTTFADLLNRFGDFVPALGVHTGPLPPADRLPARFNGQYTRFTDAQLYALARYLYSLEPLPSPYEFDYETLSLGERVFVEQGCVTCHPPPHYTNNQLTPALGFEPPEEDYERYPIFDVSVETDPGLTLHTRRGTGYYKVPSLRGLWYRERLFHDGSLSLQEVLDQARLRDDFVPSGFRGTDASRAVPGHPFGLDLLDREREALIAYLKTL